MSTEQRVYAHWQSIRNAQRSMHEGIPDYNSIFLHLARVHKMKVRHIKDIITERKSNAHS